jgi:hypothetical protein
MKSKTLFHLILITFLATLIPAMHAQTYSVIHSFTGGGTEGGSPYTGVAIRGNVLSGTTTESCGSVYQLTPSGSNWLFSTLARLPKNCTPQAKVTFGPDGHPYSTSYGGGNGGTVFRLTPPSGICKTSACYWTVTDVHDFDWETEGYQPSGDISWDQQGNIYGSTDFWGDGGAGGLVYQLMPSGNGYTENILYYFTQANGPDGGKPHGGFVPDNKGNLFGGTAWGGANSCGVIFELTNVPNVGWTYQVLYNFQGAADGISPGGLTMDSAGNLYGAAGGGYGYGAPIFELSPSGDSWVLTVLYAFPPGYGANGVVFGPDGALYGLTWNGGAFQRGNLFKLTKTQNGWQYSSLHDFGGDNDGVYPVGNVTFDTQGNMYGATSQGGTYGHGTVWMIKP